VRGIVIAGLACAVLALAGLAYAGAQIEKKPVTSDKAFTLPTGEYTLKVNHSRGVSGYPAMGTQKRRAGTLVKYSYSPASGFDGLVVKLNGAVVAASGVFMMNADRTLDAFAHPYYTLKVMETGYDVGPDEPYTCHVSSCVHEGVPACGIHLVRRGATVAYSISQNAGNTASLYLAVYPPAPGCPPSLRTLGVVNPGDTCAGTFIMDRDYTLVLTIDME
jgi:hypothetical protein